MSNDKRPNLDNLPAHMRAFYEMTEFQEQQFREHGTDATFAAAIALGEIAKSVVQDDRRAAVAELVGELTRRFAHAVAFDASAAEA